MAIDIQGRLTSFTDVAPVVIRRSGMRFTITGFPVSISPRGYQIGGKSPASPDGAGTCKLAGAFSAEQGWFIASGKDVICALEKRGHTT